MIKKTLFTIDYYEKEDFINQSEIDKLCASIDRNSLCKERPIFLYR